MHPLLRQDEPEVLQTVKLALKYTQIVSEVTTIQRESFFSSLSRSLSPSPHTFLLPSPSLSLTLSRLDSTRTRVFCSGTAFTRQLTFIHTRCTRQLRPVEAAIREGLKRTCSKPHSRRRSLSPSLSLSPVARSTNTTLQQILLAFLVSLSLSPLSILVRG